MQSSGKSGGLLSMWDVNIFEVHEVIKSSRFLITIGDWEGIPDNTILANIYGPHDLDEKKRLWDELLQIKRERQGTWILFGDFNTVRRREERLNSHFCASSAFYFNKFISDAGLHDIRLGGSKYTYCYNSLNKLSKLDRFLVCNNFVNIFPFTSTIALPRELSDHSPIILQTSFADFGKPPFRLFNSWLDREGFEEVVKSTWKEFEGYGAPNMYLMAKMKFLKNRIRGWRATDHPKEVNEILETKKRIHELDLLADDRLLSEEEINERKAGF
ncbi:uncharacterized protein LOC111912319 [Lactuca sativa]|uniref:uncharacterized protein LOC111912319 n=1 Tax=Lactuca sativa TaxID=4236 RepID=UPI000CD99E08|nr:uncharacterized protein LOC111912319 [Lactuca sativa]